MILSLITLILGLFILFKGDFHLFGRYVARSQARIIAFVLMLPLPLLFCASTILASRYVQFNADGTFSMSPEALYAASDMLSNIELIAVILAAGFAILRIFNAPQSEISVARPAAGFPAAPIRPPDIMTVAEAAAYMRVPEADVLRLIDEGKLGAARIGDTYRIARIAIEDFMQRAR